MIIVYSLGGSNNDIMNHANATCSNLPEEQL